MGLLKNFGTDKKSKIVIPSIVWQNHVTVIEFVCIFRAQEYNLYDFYHWYYSIMNEASLTGTAEILFSLSFSLHI